MFKIKIKTIPKMISTVMFAVCMGILIFALILNENLPSHYSILKGTALEFSNSLPISAEKITDLKNEKSKNALISKGKTEIYNANLNLFGVIPLKQVTVNETLQKTVVPMGTPFGIKVFTNGVMVVSVSTVENENPAEKAGIKVGDIILAVNNETVSSNNELSDKIKNSNGKTLSFTVRRDNKNVTVDFTPVKSSDGGFKGGLWVRDSTAGIGTMTFVDPQTGIYAGLGHGVCDVDTGEIMPLLSGEIMAAEVTGVNPSKEGSPGELNGHFSGKEPIGNIVKNTECGVFGNFYEKTNRSEPLPVAMSQQVKKGKAVILTSIDSSVSQYECEVEKINLKSDSDLQNMVIHITDEKLLQSAGGIVQGMSGSPIIQEGMLIGAVTHVFVDDPQRGYAIFSEKMLTTAQTLVNENKIKEAS